MMCLYNYNKLTFSTAEQKTIVIFSIIRNDHCTIGLHFNNYDMYADNDLSLVYSYL